MSARASIQNKNFDSLCLSLIHKLRRMMRQVVAGRCWSAGVLGGDLGDCPSEGWPLWETNAADVMQPQHIWRSESVEPSSGLAFDGKLVRLERLGE